jgi:hypothetical protein
MLFPYFNFESHLNNLLEPQRGLLFSLPVILAILHICFGATSASNSVAVDSAKEYIINERRRTLAAFAGICLMPFAHVVAFIMLVPCLLPRLWRERACWIRQPAGLLVFFVIGLAQLYYIKVYGPPLYHNYAAWDATQHMALRDFAFLPPPFPRLAFWIAVNGDFFLWGGLFALLAFATGRVAPLVYKRLNPLRSFLHLWKVYFIVCIAAFVLINFFRYAPNWGDSNKFTFFLNLGLSLFVALGVANTGSVSRPLFYFFLSITLFAPMWDFYAKIIRENARTHLLFHPHTRVAARWLDANLTRDARLVTAESTDTHFVTALTGRAVLAGIYSNTNPYVSQSLRASIRSIYEDANLNLLNDLNVDYIFISSHERSRYRLHSFWRQRIEDNKSLSFSIGRPDDHNSIFIMDVTKLLGSQ